MEIKLPVPATRYYEIYINKFGIDTPVNFIGVVKVEGKSNDELIDV